MHYRQQMTERNTTVYPKVDFTVGQ